MTKIYYDESKVSKLVLDNLTSSLEKLRSCKNYSDQIISVPYDFKYRDYVLNLKISNKLDYDAVNNIENFVINSSKKFERAEENLESDLADIENYIISRRKSAIK